MTAYRTRRGTLGRLGATTLAAAVVACSIGFGATSANAASPSNQPPLTSKDHAITDVPGLVNGRELGSFAGLNGQLVNAPRLLRTESLDKITSAGAATLANEYHVNLVIDLRTPTQVAAKPDVPVPGAQTVNISMFGADGNYNDDTVMYHDLVDKGYNGPSDRGPMITAYAQILRLIAQDTTGTVLIHCSHGMDRTGTVMDLLYNILGVGESDILHDYLLSNTQLNVTWATPALLQGTFESDVDSKYGGIDSYLRKTIGLTDQDFAALRTNLLVSNDATVSAITVDGVSVPLDAAASAAGATITDPQTTLTTSGVTVTTTNPNATASAAVSGRTVTITATAQDGTTVAHYIVNAALPASTTGSSTTGSGTTAAGLTSSGTVAQLPATGSDDTPVVLVGGIGGALLIIGGALLMRRRTKRAMS
ncbi:tyrosine-protein phosphatase [Microbacterium sp. SORGH_AS_0888]|uniref:tyrosine-protein phosphatase n=1 Tax=Microbacterium sp. SORGH_AS_0888 TaxID=3041791 RepID=UPI00278B89AF|nr:tyrosine-protein phosphatase [Microbacterium sp. SORGH_AS_0888]MDQ1128669.1 protein-tyrosine phosphatase [Microbacterium sp. SORGH_AS_0888]